MTAFVDSSDPLISEFEAMDMDGDGLLTKNEVFEMLIFQGVLLSEEEMKKQLQRLDSMVSLFQFITFMKSLNDSTRKLREIFALFNKEDNLGAENTDIVKTLEELGVNNAAKIVSTMISDNNRVTYKGFLQVYFQGKCCNV